jgi:hypothetical protein
MEVVAQVIRKIVVNGLWLYLAIDIQYFDDCYIVACSVILWIDVYVTIHLFPGQNVTAELPTKRREGSGAKPCNGFPRARRFVRRQLAARRITFAVRYV